MLRFFSEFPTPYSINITYEKLSISIYVVYNLIARTPSSIWYLLWSTLVLWKVIHCANPAPVFDIAYNLAT